MANNKRVPQAPREPIPELTEFLEPFQIHFKRCESQKALDRYLTGVYLPLQHLDRVRVSKLKVQTMLKNQVIGHLDRLFPGLVIQGQEATDRYTPLFATPFWQCRTLQHLIRVCPEPRRLASLTPTELAALFHARRYPLGLKNTARIIAYAQKVLLPDAELVAIRSELLQHDLALLGEVKRHPHEIGLPEIRSNPPLPRSQVHAGQKPAAGFIQACRMLYQSVPHGSIIPAARLNS